MQIHGKFGGFVLEERTHFERQNREDILSAMLSEEIRQRWVFDLMDSLADIHQRLTDTLFKLSATGNNVDLDRIESSVLDFNPGVLVVVGTPHLGDGCRILPPDLFDRRIESRTQSKSRNKNMNLEPRRREQGIRRAASRQLLRMIRVTNKGCPVEIILTKCRACLGGAPAGALQHGGSTRDAPQNESGESK